MKPILLALWLSQVQEGDPNVVTEERIRHVEELGSHGKLIKVWFPLGRRISVNTKTGMCAFIDANSKEVIILEPSYVIHRMSRKRE